MPNDSAKNRRNLWVLIAASLVVFAWVVLVNVSPPSKPRAASRQRSSTSRRTSSARPSAGLTAAEQALIREVGDLFEGYTGAINMLGGLSDVTVATAQRSPNIRALVGDIAAEIRAVNRSRSELTCPSPRCRALCDATVSYAWAMEHVAGLLDGPAAGRPVNDAALTDALAAAVRHQNRARRELQTLLNR